MRLEPGNEVNNYTIVRYIGGGGMGSVYLAEEQLTRRPVAIKVLNSNLVAQKAFIERFVNEARIMATMQHPNIVNLYNFARVNDEYYMAMEYAEGMTLRDLITANERIHEKHALAYLTQIVQALAYAHSRGVIHRDIKPGNIIINSHNQVKITDFGIARMMGDVHMTSTGTAIGTVSYMSPEQIRAPRDVDHSTDIYSAGVVFFEMLTGQLPFYADTGSQFEIEKLIVENNLPDRGMYPFVSEENWQLISMMITADRSARPSPDQLLDILHGKSRPIPLKPRPVTPEPIQLHVKPSLSVPEPQSDPIKTEEPLVMSRSQSGNLWLWILLLIGLSAAVYFILTKDTTVETAQPEEVVADTLQYVTVRVNQLRLRDNPGRSTNEIGVLNSGDRVGLTGNKTTWTEKLEMGGNIYDQPWVEVMTANGTKGWIYAGATDMQGVYPQGPAPKPEPAPVAAHYITVKVDVLNVRSSPGVAQRVVATLEYGDRVQWTGNVTNWRDQLEVRNSIYTAPWVEVRLASGKTGWVFSAATSLAEEWGE